MSSKRSAAGLVAGLAILFFLVAPASPEADLQAAKQEGKVVWYVALTTDFNQQVCDLFNKKGFGVQCVFHRDGAGPLYRRYLQEAKSNINVADVFTFSNLGYFFQLKQGGYLLPYRPRGTERFNPFFTTEDGSWMIPLATAQVPAYNTKLVKPSELPTSWTDFLRPEWKDRLVLPNPSFSGVAAEVMIAMVKKFGWDYFEKLAKQNPRIVPSASGTLTFVERGESHMVVYAPLASVFDHAQRGEPLKMFVPKEGVLVNGIPSAIPKNAPHPNAAKLFVDFLFSREVQQLIVDSGYHVGHPEVKYPPGLPPFEDLKPIFVSPEDAEKETPSMKEGFRKFFGV